MAAFFLLLAIIGGIVVGDLVWENTTAGELTVFDQPITGYPQGWLLAMAAALGFLVGLLLVASASSTKARRARRKQLRAMRRDPQDREFELEGDHATWLDESFGRRETALDPGELVKHRSEPLYGQTTSSAGLRDNPDRGVSHDQDPDGGRQRRRPPRPGDREPRRP